MAVFLNIGADKMRGGGGERIPDLHRREAEAQMSLQSRHLHP